MRLLLDTQILIWLADDRARLNEREKAAMTSAHELVASAISLMELRIKARAETRRGRAPSLLSPANAIAFCQRWGMVIYPVEPADVTVSLAIDPVHGDPFDELMLAHAQALGARLLTRDRKLLDHPLAYHP